MQTKPNDPMADPRRCVKLPSGCDKPLCVEVPKHPRCKAKATPAERVKKLQDGLDAANAKVESGATCSAELKSLKSQVSQIQSALADCNSKKTACERSKPVNNGAFNLNTRADMNHIRTGAGRKVYGTYQRGPKKGKLKKGYRFIDGVATKV